MQIRNFSIIAHIDHGKSTLADRLLQSTHAVSEREARDQILDSMDLERERGITIKASAVTVKHVHKGEEFMLNFIDTPGHVDFTYEVSRALKACEGAVLVVNSTQGVQAQTLANAYLAVAQDLVLIPVINKIDLPGAQPDKVAMEVEQILGLPAEDCLLASAKTGQGIDELLSAICEQLPPPRATKTDKLRALIFDSHYDDYRGVIVYIRVFDGRIKVGDKIRMMGSGRTWPCTELGKYTPKPQKVKEIGPGETGYMVAQIKSLSDVRVGDTITLDIDPAAEALEGYEEPKQMVYCDFYPATDVESSGNDFEELREAMMKLSLNDASFTFEPVHSEALGFGFRCGFLGLLHMDIIQERLEREGGVQVVQTAPTVTYKLVKTTGEEVEVHNPADLPDPSVWRELKEPIVRLECILPSEYVGDVMGLCMGRRGVFKSQTALSEQRQMVIFEVPLAEIIYDFFDKLKSMTRGYATMDYEVIDYRSENLVKVDILINGAPVEALSFISHRDNADRRGRGLLVKLKEQIDRHQFEIPLQAAIGGKIIARESIKAVRKNVTAKCYGGDVSRKRKLLEKQKEGKKRMKAIGAVDIPQEAFMAVLDQGEQALPDDHPTIVVLGGPNGAGKSTAAAVLIPGALGLTHYINADAIARGIAPFAPESAAIPAARIMLHRMNELADARESFAFESTLAGKGIAQWLRKRIASGYRLRLLFFWLSSSDVAVERVAVRVREGGHDVAQEVIRRRYRSGLRNLSLIYLPLAADWQVYDNTGFEPTLVAIGGADRPTEVLAPETWNRIRSGADA